MAEKKRIPVEENKTVGKYVGKGLKAYKGKIKTSDDVTGMTFKSGNKCEIGIRLLVDIGYEKPQQLYFLDEFKEENGVRTGYKRGNFSNIISLLSRVLGKGNHLYEDFTIPKDVIDALEGKEIIVLKYTNDFYTSSQTGKEGPSWQTWNKVGVGTEEELGKEFLDEYNKSGFPKDYDPTILDQLKDQKEDDTTSFKPDQFKDAPSDFDDDPNTI